jgi:hypothetical protein
MTRDEQIWALFSLHGRMSIRMLATAAIDAGIFPSYSPRVGVESACRRAVSAMDEATGHKAPTLATPPALGAGLVAS